MATHICDSIKQRLKAEGDQWRLLLLPDHPTPCALRTHTRDAVPFAMAGKGTAGIVEAPFTEQTAKDADLHIAKGYSLMEFFLTAR